MRLQIDTSAKTIKVEGTVKFDELIKALKKLLPKEWEEYSLESGTVINWHYYPVYQYRPYTIEPLFYTSGTITTYGNNNTITNDPNCVDSSTITTRNSCFNVEIN